MPLDVQAELMVYARKGVDLDDYGKLVDLIPKDAAHYDALMAELVRLGCVEAIRQARVAATVAARATGIVRKSAAAAGDSKTGAGWQPPAAEGAAIAARMRAVNPAYDWSLPNGALLGMASIADLENAIAVHKVKATANVALVKFYSAVKAKLLREKAHTVSDVIGAAELQVLRDASGVIEHE